MLLTRCPAKSLFRHLSRPTLSENLTLHPPPLLLPRSLSPCIPLNQPTFLQDPTFSAPVLFLRTNKKHKLALHMRLKYPVGRRVGVGGVKTIPDELDIKEVQPLCASQLVLIPLLRTTL